MSASPEFSPSLVAASLRIEEITPLLGPALGRVDIHALAECDSSNTHLLALAKAGVPSGTVVCADRQTAGRGRRGRVWHHAEQGLAFSVLWRFPLDLNVHGLSLAVGLALAECLGDQVQLKWPNDVLLEDKKLAGILLESNSPGSYVIGIGLNQGSLEQLPADIIAGATSLALESREHLLARVLDSLVTVLDEFGRAGFAGMRTRWLARHAYQNQPVTISTDGQTVMSGVCVGVDGDGALLLSRENGIERILSGDVSVRKQ